MTVDAAGGEGASRRIEVARTALEPLGERDDTSGAYADLTGCTSAAVMATAFRITRSTALSFSTDRDLRYWMVGYYLNSTGFRLDAAREALGSVPESHVQHRFDELHGRGGLIDVPGAPNKAWDVYFDAFLELFTILRDRTDAHRAASDCA